MSDIDDIKLTLKEAQDYNDYNERKKQISEEDLQAWTYENEVFEDKRIRKLGDIVIQYVKNLPKSTERDYAIKSLTEGVMWMGQDLKRLGEANPYPSSKDPSTGTTIEPTADGLKF